MEQRTGALLIGLIFVVALSANGQLLQSPVRIAEGPPGQLLVSDHQQQAVSFIDKATLQSLWSFNVGGSPAAVAHAANLVFIGFPSTHNVGVYKLKGSPGERGKTLEFLYNLAGTQNPTDMSLDKDWDRVFVLDAGEARVKVFDFKGNAIDAFPHVGSSPLKTPAAIAVDTVRKEVLISDWGDKASRPRVAIYDYSGQALGEISTLAADFQFARPQGLTVDSAGHISLVDCLLGKVFVFDRSSSAGLKTLGEPGQLKYALDVVVDERTGDVFVTNNAQGRVERFPGAGRIQ